MTTHVRITVRAGRRINDQRGSTHTLCGSLELTAYDVAYADAKRSGTADRAKWVGCAACLAKLPPATKE